ncbi:hypothetical protein C8Q70DRAFT_561422 [Cubamyces menziesii]|nr:hypothetical protein C8Q70DRAFT_561422 [Cubamyces menziesii]
MPSTRVFGLLHILGVAALWTHLFLPGLSAEVVNYLEQGFFFDWTGDQSPPVPTAAQCDTLHITWGRRTATGPNPVAPYYLQIYTSTFIVPFIIPAGDDTSLSYDWVVPFVPGTQFQMCMVASNGVTGGCQNIFTVYQRPNTTLDDPPTCFNLTYPHAPLGVDASLADGTWSQYGWVDQCSDISLKPVNGTPPYTYTIAPALHPPFNITSHTTDAVNWTVSLMYGMPFFVTVSDANGIGWTNGPLHPTGAGSTKCLDLDSALGKQSSSDSKGISSGAAVGLGLGTLILGALLGLAGSYAFHRWHYYHRVPGRPSPFDHGRKFSETGETPILSMHPGSATSATFVGRNAEPFNADELGQIQMQPHSPATLSPSGATTGSFSRMPSTATFDRPRSAADAPTSPTHQHQHSNSSNNWSPPATPSGQGPASSGMRMPALGQGGSHVYVVHHDAGRPPPVTVFTSDGTEVVELPPQYESAAADARRTEQMGASGQRPLPLSPDQRRMPRNLPPKPNLVASNADAPPSSSSTPPPA